ncbi:nuclear receptor coactivator 7 isoform X8 [Vespula squamosa]|uniref:Nuclear receptor coactivator 7 isoform X8 n=1 Tax=Vespula squamosa TaxID=30214 RepID=A0ABD2ANX1_VESSQ
MESEMYIKDQNEEEVIEYNLNSKKNGQQQQQQVTMKYASTNSIPSTMEEENENTFDRRIMGERFAGVRSAASAAILRESITGTGTTTNNTTTTTTNINPSTVSAKGRRYSVLEDLKARKDSLWQRARRTSTFEEKENAKQQKIVYGKEKRRSSDGGAARRGSVFYVSDDLLEEKQDVIVNKEEERAAIIEAKKGRRKSWHPLASVKPSKSERKRKKAVVGAPPVEQVASAEALYTHTRQKRPSWWNIFVPDSVSRFLE